MNRSAPFSVEMKFLCCSIQIMQPTLLELTGSKLEVSRFKESALLIIDAQREYQDGALRLQDFAQALAHCKRALDYARNEATPIFHIVHHGKTGSPIFDPNEKYVEIVEELEPEWGEMIIKKSFPNSFLNTELHRHLQNLGIKNLIIGGFMTHMCVSSTVRAGLDLGYRSTIIANACSTRDLTGFDGLKIPANLVHTSTLAALRDRFAAVVESIDEIPASAVTM